MPAMAPVIGDEQGMPGRALRIRENTLSSPITMAPDVHVKPATSIRKLGMITRMPPSTSFSMRANVSGVIVASFQMRELVEIDTGQREDAPELVLAGLVGRELD